MIDSNRNPELRSIRAAFAGDSMFFFEHPLRVWMTHKYADVANAFVTLHEEQRQHRYVVALIRYEAGPAFDPAIRAHESGDRPLVWFASFAEPSAPRDFITVPGLSPAKPRIHERRYARCLSNALEHIRKGDIYQVNFTIRADIGIAADPWSVWRSLLRAVPVPHAAFVDCGDVQVISLSPELFLKRRGSLLETRPMKGTAARRPSWEEDEAARIALEESAKDRAENTMIVDLMRNDFSRVCRAGTVRVAELCRACRFPTVHQMTSAVQGELKEGTTAFDIFRAAFPPGSVTGAPKVRATEIIFDLESEPRGIYCGSIGLFYPNGDFDCNVAIRTLESVFHSNRNLSEKTKESSSVHPASLIPRPFLLGLGSGIVVDSDPASEWRETLIKAKFAHQRPQEFGLFETFRYVPQGSRISPSRTKPLARRAASGSARLRLQENAGSRNPAGIYRNLHSHLRRLKNSCDYFSRSFPLRNILLTLRDLKPILGDQPHRVRLELKFERIAVRLIDEHLSWPAEGISLLISDARLDPEDPRLYHKTTDREEKYQALQIARSRGAHEVLFLNTRGELCEGAISNILLKVDGEWLTPALSCGLLPGVWRAHQLKSGRAREAVLTLDGLSRADEILMGNSVRGEGPVLKILNLP